MKKMNVNEMKNINGGYYFHCHVCCAYYGSGLTTYFKWMANAHVLGGKHKKAVKAIGYGHYCCGR